MGRPAHLGQGQWIERCQLGLPAGVVAVLRHVDGLARHREGKFRLPVPTV
jgi:hypothetical protein